LGLGCGLSPFLHGFYDLSAWGPICLGLLALAVALTVVRPTLPSRPALAVLGGLAGLAVWSRVSEGWAESTFQAALYADRWTLYAAFLLVVTLLLRRRVDANFLIGGATAGVLAVALYLVARMALGGEEGLFLSGRLNEPLEYINGEAGLFLIALWPLIAVAERRHPVWSPLALAGATVLAGLLLLGQARGVVIGLLLAALVLVAAVPGRRDRVWVLLALAAATAAAAGPLLDVYQQRGATAPPDATVRSAAGWLILVSVLAGLGWAAVCAGARRFERSPDAARGARRAADGALAVLATIALVVGLASAGTIAHQARVQTRAFVHLQGHAGSTRLLSGGGYRYDYWRIALREFRDEPLHGVGAGNYVWDYYLQRQNVENITNPHSLPLQVLAELGAVGGLAFALLLGGVVAGFAGRVRRSRADAWQRMLAVAGGGAFVAWLVDTSVDWLHLLPGVTGFALIAAAVLTLPRDGSPPAPLRPPRAWAAMAAVAVAAALAAVPVARSTLAQHLRTESRRALSGDSHRALDKARDSLRLEPDSVQGFQLQSAAHAAENRYPQTRDSLLEAAKLEPSNFVTWALLGDLAERRGYPLVARRYYARALALNPRDPLLRDLAAK
jgi:hypothetical protein